jgi:hypothetical protein
MGPLVVASAAIWYIQRLRSIADAFKVANSLITAYFSLTMSSNIICSGELPLASIPSFPPWFTYHARIIFLRNRGYCGADILCPEISSQRKCADVLENCSHHRREQYTVLTGRPGRARILRYGQ